MRISALIDHITIQGFDKTASVELKLTSNIVSEFEFMYSELKDIYELLVIASDASDLEFLNDCVMNYKTKIDSYEIKIFFDSDDNKNAILSINAGEGGKESQDWARMLFRMYRMWALKHNFALNIINIISNDDNGIKTVDVVISGLNVYGWLKCESGIHRLVRNSPFDSNKRRHTSFAAVSVSPEINDDIKIEINDCEIKRDTFRSSGSGGQSVNKTESAIRLTHIPTGIVVTCQNERSQHTNEDIAIKILKSKLYERELQIRKNVKQSFYNNLGNISWGMQRRSYFLQPKVIIKDHITRVSEYDSDKVFNGGIDNFIKSALLIRMNDNV